MLHELQGAGDGLVHVVVSVVAEAAEEMNVGIFRAGGFEIPAVQGGVFLSGNGVVGLVHAAAIGRGILERNHGAGRLVVEKVLVFADAGEIVVFRVVDHGIRLEEFAVVFAEPELDAPIGQIAETPVHEFIHGAGVEDAAVAVFALHVVPGGAEADRDVFMIEHAFEHGGVAVQRNALPAVLEIAVVAAHVHRHAPRDCGIEVFGFHAPLLHGVEEKHLLIDVFREEVEVGIVGFAQFENGHLFVEAEALDEFFLEAGGESFGEYPADGIQVERNGHELTVDEAEHPVHVGMPFGEAGNEVPGGLHVGVEDVGAVLVDADAVFVAVIVAVAAYVRLLVDDKNLLAAFGKRAGHGCAGNAGSDNDVLHAGVLLSVFSLCCVRTSRSELKS